MAAFSRYIGIDYSGAETPESSLKGLRVYCAVGASAATEVPPPPSPRKYWTRRGIAHWLAERLAEDVPTIVGIDTSKSIGCHPTGRRFLRTSSDTGPRTPSTPMSTSFATAWPATAVREPAAPAGAG